MERFVIGAAIFAAVAIAAGSYFGHAVSDKEGFRFEINTDDDTSGGPGSGAPSTLAAKTYAGAELSVRNAVAVLNVIPEDRADISIEITNPGRLTTPNVRVSGDRVYIDGGLGNREQQCNGGAAAQVVNVRGVGDVTWTQAPTIVARVPRDVELKTDFAVKTTVGPSDSVDLEVTGCGGTEVGAVAGALELAISGSGPVRAASAGSLAVSSAGSGSLKVGDVTGEIEVSLASSGGATVASGGGALDASIAGSGDLTIEKSIAQDADISIAGSGDVTISGSVQSLDISIAGSGDVNVGSATDVDSNILGSGDVRIGVVTGRLDSVIMGSGTVTTGSQARPLKQD